MSLREQIQQALSKPFNAAAQGLDPSEYFGLAVWHDGPTLDESWIKISRELNTDSGKLVNGKWIPAIDPDAQTDIDILDKRGTGGGSIKDINEIKAKFKQIKRVLPPGEYHMNADDPRKAVLYQRSFLKDPDFRLSGETAQGRYTNKKGEVVKKKFETMIMTVPGDEEAWAKDWRTQGVPQTEFSKEITEELGDSLKDAQYNKQPGRTFGNGLIPEDVALEKFENYSRLRTLEIEEALAMNKKPKTRGGQFMVKDKQGNKHYFGFEQAGYKKGAPAKRTFMLDGMGYKIYRSSEKAFRDATRETLKLNQTPSNMTPRQWLQIKDLYDQAGTSKGKLEVDHIWPLEKGGLHEPGNLRLLDRSANRSKGSKVDTDFPDAPYNARIGFSKTEWGWADRMAKKHGSLFRKLGGVSTKLSGADSAVQFASGNYVGGGIGLAMQTPTFQKAIAKRLAKSGAKMVPGVGVGMSALEAAGYASQGRWTQAGIASLSGLVGEVPLAGDLVSAALDLTNTGIDLATGNLGGSPDEDKIKRQVGGSFDFSKPRTYVPSKFRY